MVSGIVNAMTASRRTRITLQNVYDCTCVYSCRDHPATMCGLSGEWHVHPRVNGDFGPCPIHPDAPGDL